MSDQNVTTNTSTVHRPTAEERLRAIGAEAREAKPNVEESLALALDLLGDDPDTNDAVVAILKRLRDADRALEGMLLHLGVYASAGEEQ